MLTHANLSAACAQYLETTHVGPNPLVEGEERTLCVLPLFHIYALSVLLVLGLRLGAEIVLHPRFDPPAALKDIVQKKITVYVGVPTMHIAMLNLPGVRPENFSIKQCSSGGAPLPYAVQQDFEKLVGCRLAEGWGMSETSPTGTFTPNAGEARPGSCGIPLPGIEFKFIDVDDPTREVALGERGEMCIKGPNVMKGYWKKPEATAAAITEDGYLRTGDVAIMAEDGYVTIVDRIKDMLLVGGFNVYPEHRGGDLPASRGRGGRSDRRSRRLSWRKAEGLRQTEGRLAAPDVRAAEGVSERPARPARDDRRAGALRRPAEDRGRQDLEEGLARGRGAAARRLIRGAARPGDDRPMGYTTHFSERFPGKAPPSVSTRPKG